MSSPVGIEKKCVIIGSQQFKPLSSMTRVSTNRLPEWILENSGILNRKMCMVRGDSERYGTEWDCTGNFLA